MPTTHKQTDIVKVKQYVTDPKGHKKATILDMKELEGGRSCLKTLPTSRRLKTGYARRKKATRHTAARENH